MPAQLHAAAQIHTLRGVGRPPSRTQYKKKGGPLIQPTLLISLPLQLEQKGTEFLTAATANCDETSKGYTQQR
jgi:hypothetical protein